jgi:predicted nucleotidyltransferase
MRGAIERVVRQIVDYYGPEQVILFGSYARTQENAASDVDLLVLLETDIPFGFREGAAKGIARECPVPFDLHFYRPSEVAEEKNVEGSFLWTVFNTGTILYKKNLGFCFEK